MSAVLAVKTLDELIAEFGPMRTVLHYKDRTDTPAEQHQAFALNILGGKTLRESTVRAKDGSEDLIIQAVEYIDPVTRKPRFAVDYWSEQGGYWTRDHEMRAVIDSAYEDAVRAEFAAPSLCMDHHRFMTGGLRGFYDTTDMDF